MKKLKEFVYIRDVPINIEGEIDDTGKFDEAKKYEFAGKGIKYLMKKNSLIIMPPLIKNLTFYV